MVLRPTVIVYFVYDASCTRRYILACRSPSTQKRRRICNACLSRNTRSISALTHPRDGTIIASSASMSTGGSEKRALHKSSEEYESIQTLPPAPGDIYWLVGRPAPRNVWKRATACLSPNTINYIGLSFAQHPETVSACRSPSTQEPSASRSPSTQKRRKNEHL